MPLAFGVQACSLLLQLNKMDFALRTVGSSCKAIHATYCLKRGIRGVRDLYGINTASLFPTDNNVKVYRGEARLFQCLLRRE